MNTAPNRNHCNFGFTLIEMAIVVVVIGFIAGGILVGRDLIKSSEIRAAIAQYEEFNNAVSAFSMKYNDGLPGDLPVTDAANFGLFSGSLTGNAIGDCDGNGLIESGVDGSGIRESFQHNEPLIFWRHLSEAGFIKGNYGANMTTWGFVSAADSASNNITAYFPPASIIGNYWFTGSYEGFNYYILAGINPITSGGSMSIQGKLSPNISYSIDSKIDDGMPNLGNVQTRRGGINTDTAFYDVSSANAAYSSVAGTNALNCLAGSNTKEAVTNVYATNSTVGNSLNCTLRLRFR